MLGLMDFLGRLGPYFTAEERARITGWEAVAADFQPDSQDIYGVPAGSASARYADGIAQLCGASTIPRFRRRGVQRALSTIRLAAAVADGCTLAIVTTAPGSQSQANVMRLGFELIYARAILVRGGAPAA